MYKEVIIPVIAAAIGWIIVERFRFLNEATAAKHQMLVHLTRYRFIRGQLEAQRVQSRIYHKFSTDPDVIEFHRYQDYQHEYILEMENQIRLIHIEISNIQFQLARICKYYRVKKNNLVELMNKINSMYNLHTEESWAKQLKEIDSKNIEGIEELKSTVIKSTAKHLEKVTEEILQKIDRLSTRILSF